MLTKKGVFVMIINASSIGMSSERAYNSYSSSRVLGITMKADVAATLELSEEGKSYLLQLEEQLKEREKEQKQSQKDNEQRSMKQMLRQLKSNQTQQVSTPLVKSEDDAQIQMLRQLLKALNNAKNGDFSRFEISRNQIQSMSRMYGSTSSTGVSIGKGQPGGGITGIFGSASVSEEIRVSGSNNATISVMNLSSGNGNTNGSMWTRITASETTHTEWEYTTFRTAGVAVTADGREISFNVDLEMSRACVGISSELMMENYFVTDPLVINLDKNVATVTDQKFVFDLDADGKEEEISFVGKGSGFLAYDKNDDGTINDGNELFGTQSGDGFKDLASYDEDKNGWIDEADSIFNKLKVWTKDENGNDKLIDIKQAGIGAMYLGSSETQFHLKNAVTNNTNGIIQKSGVYLREDGSAGTLQHVDLVI